MKKALVVSAINFFEGGPLSLLNDCLKYLNESNLVQDFRVIALVYKKELFKEDSLTNIDFFEFPESRESYFKRLYYEYTYFKKFAKEQNVDFWLSLHDITPNVGNIQQAVYCHNPSPFNEINLKDIFIDPTLFFFRIFYKYLYKHNIEKNKYVIVQQQWLRDEFANIFSIDKNKIIVAIPRVPVISPDLLKLQTEADHSQKIFFFPTLPRLFKNIEVICEAVKILQSKNQYSFTVMITIDGTENKYSQLIFKKYGYLENIKFIGRISRHEVYELYAKSSYMIFPSKLETWGLPISEFKQFNKPIFVADMPYARETVGDYDKSVFFNPNDPAQLAELIERAVLNYPLEYHKAELKKYDQPFAGDWEELFTILLANK